jgi:hypothetical protein
VKRHVKGQILFDFSFLSLLMMCNIKRVKWDLFFEDRDI